MDVPWTFPMLDVHASRKQGIPYNTNNDNEGNNFPVNDIEYETTHQDDILDDTVLVVDIFPEPDVESITMEITSDSNKEYTYAAMTEIILQTEKEG